jgi:hypothetical protein
MLRLQQKVDLLVHPWPHPRRILQEIECSSSTDESGATLAGSRSVVLKDATANYSVASLPQRPRPLLWALLNAPDITTQDLRDGAITARAARPCAAPV